MGYVLGIDVGTTYTAAAIGRDGQVDIVTLANSASAMPSVAFLREDGTLLTGETAQRRGVEDPTRIARHFKRRLGDQTPLMLGSTPYSAERLMALLVTTVLERVRELEGGDPERVALTHPANWGPFKLELLAQVASLAGLGGADLITEPEAAAIQYASAERVSVGDIVAVYDLGGGTFDAAVLRRTDDGFEIVGEPTGIERLGGIDLDAAVLEHVRRSAPELFEGLDSEDPATATAMATLRADCAAAKEALSEDVDAVIRVSMPAGHSSVRITRDEFESMIHPLVAETVAALRRAVDSAGVSPETLRAVLLIGGSSRIPVIADTVARELGRPVAVDAHPKNTVAYGAVRRAMHLDAVAPPPPVASATATGVPAPAVPHPPVRTPPRRRRGLVVAAIILVLAVVGAGTAAYALSRADDGDVPVVAAETPSPSRTSARPTTTRPTPRTTTPAVDPAPDTGGDSDTGGDPGPDTGSDEACGAECRAVMSSRPTSGVTCLQVAPGTPCIEITEIWENGSGELVTSWDPVFFTPDAATGYRAHFYLSVHSAADAGRQSDGSTNPRIWEATDRSPHLAGSEGSPAITLAAREEAAGSDLCVTVADAAAVVVDPSVYQCWGIDGP